MTPEQRSNLMNVDLAHTSLQHLTVGRTVNFLNYLFDSGEDLILRPRYETVPIQLTMQDVSSAQLACLVEIEFFGGPPGEEDWHKGSLLSMLIDRLFYCIVQEKDDMVNQFLLCINGNST